MAAAVLSAAMVFSGCSDGVENSKTSSVSQPMQSTQSTSAASTTQSSDSSQRSASAVSTSAANTAQSSDISQSSAPAVIASSFHSSSSIGTNAESSSSAVSTPAPTTSSETTFETTFEEEHIGSDEHRTVSSGEKFHVKAGEALYVDGTLTVESGAKLVVDNNGKLCVSGTVELGGTLELSEGGRLSMINDNACIDGDGDVAVCDFRYMDCGIGTIKARITPPERIVKDGVTTVGGIVIANKAISLPPEYGSDLSLNELTPETYNALVEMNLATGHQYVNRSGYRSYYYQKTLFQNYCDMYGYEKADTLSSHAGHSEHQTGLTIDLDSFSENYGNTPEGSWLAENCWRYGFIIRYPKGKEYITGYAYEPWHVRYLGKSTAKLVFDSGLTLEEFLNVEGGTTVID